MALDNFNLPMNLLSSKFDTRRAPSKYTKSDLGFRFEMGEGVRPAEYVAPYRYLPVAFQDTSTEDYVVIPKGRIVSIASTENATPSGGIVYPASSGSITIGSMAAELGGSGISVNIDTSYFGYDAYINGLLVPANGGAAATTHYTARDVDAGTRKYGGALAAAEDTFVNPANIPVGVAFNDWYQDIDGKNLNYKMWADGGNILTDWFVEVPYVKAAGKGTTLVSGVVDLTPGASGTYANATKWSAVNSKFAYLCVASGSTFTPGALVQADAIGNYAIQGTGTVTQAYTAQTVGKILGIDNRFPKSGMEDVQTYPRSGMPGTQTAGLPKFLFDFVGLTLTAANGVAPTVEQILTAVRSGDFGLVRIQLSVS